jgi:hypothetical protein
MAYKKKIIFGFFCFICDKKAPLGRRPLIVGILYDSEKDLFLI